MLSAPGETVTAASKSSSGELPGGREFDGASDLMQILSTEKKEAVLPLFGPQNDNLSPWAGV